MTFYELLLALDKKLNTPNFTGLQFKMNTDPTWKETISLRCNRVHLDHIVVLVGLCIEMAKEFSANLERVSINKCYRVQDTTTKKTFIPDRRTVYVTVRPPKDIFDILFKDIEATLKEDIQYYFDIAPLLSALERNN